MFAESLTPRPELENSQDPKRTRAVQDFLQRKFRLELFNLASLNNFDNCAILAAMRRASSRVSSFVIKKLIC